MARLDRFRAHDILRRCKVLPGADFHALDSATVESLIREADAIGYRKPRNANGSRARYFHAYVQRAAARDE